MLKKYCCIIILINRVVRLTTPLLNYIIISGALLMYISVFIGLLPTIDQNVVKMQCIVSYRRETEFS